MRNLIVIGASAGGLTAIGKLLSDLPAELDAAVLIVLHLSKKSNSEIIAGTFQKKTRFRCWEAADEMEILAGNAYIAPANRQLMISNNKIKVTEGPHENKYRPSIDVLFRSAAVHGKNRTIGIILTGMLEDGTSGMSAIKRCGGICIVQEPLEAEFPDMPQSVLNNITVDYRAPLQDIPEIIKKVMGEPLPTEIPVPNELQIEATITENMMSDINQLKQIASHSDFTCPECGGGLWAIKNDPTHRYRCHTGHVYTEKLLQDLQDVKIEESIWVCIRMLEEKHNMLLLLNRRDDESGSAFYQRRVDDVVKHINRLKLLLAKLTEDLSNTG